MTTKTDKQRGEAWIDQRFLKVNSTQKSIFALVTCMVHLQLQLVIRTTKSKLIIMLVLPCQDCSWVVWENRAKYRSSHESCPMLPELVSVLQATQSQQGSCIHHCLWQRLKQWMSHAVEVSVPIMYCSAGVYLKSYLFLVASKFGCL